mmetsp:Transcript_46956/g.75179  ORF Transcript_46956/g.75179 Transcript_46956/m.75179 type:complete len:269 (-) Transcript_46956:1002-1808(-)
MFNHVRSLQRIPNFPVIIPRSNACNHTQFAIAMQNCDNLRCRHQLLTKAHMLHFLHFMAFLIFLEHRNHLSIHMQLANHGTIHQLRKDLAYNLKIATNPQPHKAENRLFIARLIRYKILCAIARFIASYLEHNLVILLITKIQTLASNLSAPNTRTLCAICLHPFLQELPQIRHLVATHYVLIGNVSDHSIQTYPRMNMALHLNQQRQQLFGLKRSVLALFEPFLNHRKLRSLTRIYLPLIRLNESAVEHIIKHFLVEFHRATRKIWH